MSLWELPTARGVLRWRGTAVMGILNATPDSFSDGGLFADPEVAINHGLDMMNRGAMLVDVGGESTRPGAELVAPELELERVLPVIRGLAAHGVPISIDTRKPVVAEAALEAGAWLVNDVGGLRDPCMLSVCSNFGAAVVVMHMQGEPQTMQSKPRYRDVVQEVRDELSLRAGEAARAGIPGVVLDPGIGFGKTLEHNLELLRNLDAFRPLGPPVMVGVSRKGMLGHLAGVPAAADRDAASLAVHLHAALMGVALVRVHDVPGHVQALKVQAAIRDPGR